MTRFYTYKKQVPLKPGEKIGYQRGRGYYVIPVPPAYASPFSGRGVFTTSEPQVVNGHACDWQAAQADPEGNLSWAFIGPRQKMMWMARPDGDGVTRANMAHMPFIGQAESQKELDVCLALGPHIQVPKALVGNAGAWTDEGRAKALAQGWDLIQEWYWNAHPWEQSPDAHNYPRFVNVCFGIYSEGEPGGQGYVPQSKSVADYRAVWRGSFSVWRGEAMTEQDWQAFGA